MQESLVELEQDRPTQLRKVSMSTVRSKLEPVKVMHVITGLGIGGAETTLHKLLSRIDRERFQNTVYSMTGWGPMAERILTLGIDVQTLGMRRGLPDPRAILRLTNGVRKWRPDVIQTWMYHADLLGAVVGIVFRHTPVVWNIRHSDLHEGLDKWMTIRVARFCARVSARLPTRIVCCAESSRRLHIQLGYLASKIVVIPNGFDLGMYKPNPSARESCEASFGIPPTVKVISIAARYHPQKDHKTFFKAATLCHAIQPDVRFVLCGEGVTWDNQELVTQIEQAGLRDRTFLLGRLIPEDVALIMARSVVTTSASRGEGFPNVIGEAMSCGTMCVVTDVGDSAYVVGDTGIVVSPGSPEALAGGWIKLLSMSDEERAERGGRARQRVETNFGLPAVVSRYQDLYEELARSRAFA